MKKNKTEILAPAGGMKQLIAAINASADAVYIGAKNFSARKSAENFSEEQIPQIINLCHENGVKIYATINTLLNDREIENALKLVSKFYESGADAVILADEGLSFLVNKYIPNFKMHASTQMATFNYEDIVRLQKLGFSRMVLPRELSFDDIKIIQNSININNLIDKFGNRIEIEVFCHGALCMCVSGKCYFSSLIGQRSGNRGRCAQPCRLPFHIDKKLKKNSININKNSTNNKNSLSLKDLFISDYAKKLIEIGVASLKIEGRMKSPEYVYETTKSFKNIDNIQNKEKILEDLFSRNGFTNGYLEGKLNNNMFGIRTNENEKNTVKSNETIDYTINLNKKPEIIIEKREKINLPFLAEKSKNSNRFATFLLCFKHFEQIGEIDKKFEIFLDFTSAIKNITYLKEKNISGIILPKIICESTISDFKSKLLLLKNAGIKSVFGSNVGSLKIAKKIGFEINADFALNVFNSFSIKQLENLELDRVILSCELSFPQIRDLNKTMKCGIVGYGKLNLMSFKTCIIKNNSSCITNVGYQNFIDRYDNKFHIFCEYDCCNSLYNGKPIFIADLDYNNIGLNFIRLDFTTETQEEVNSIIKKYKISKKADFDFTRGLYNKGVL